MHFKSDIFKCNIHAVISYILSYIRIYFNYIKFVHVLANETFTHICLLIDISSQIYVNCDLNMFTC